MDTSEQSFKTLLSNLVSEISNLVRQELRLAQAEAGIFFCPPASILQEFPAFPAAYNYDEMATEFMRASQRELSP